MGVIEAEFALLVFWCCYVSIEYDTTLKKLLIKLWRKGNILGRALMIAIGIPLFPALIMYIIYEISCSIVKAIKRFLMISFNMEIPDKLDRTQEEDDEEETVKVDTSALKKKSLKSIEKKKHKEEYHLKIKSIKSNDSIHNRMEKERQKIIRDYEKNNVHSLFILPSELQNIHHFDEIEIFGSGHSNIFEIKNVHKLKNIDIPLEILNKAYTIRFCFGAKGNWKNYPLISVKSIIAPNAEYENCNDKVIYAYE
jgi:hypothetical protein